MLNMVKKVKSSKQPGKLAFTWLPLHDLAAGS